MEENSDKKKKKDPYKANNEKNSKIINSFSPKQMERYLAFKQGNFNKKEVKKIIQNTITIPIGTSTEKHLAICVGGVAKIFIGEIIEKAREVAVEWGESIGKNSENENILLPLLPSHILEAHRRLSSEDPILRIPSSFLN